MAMSKLCSQCNERVATTSPPAWPTLVLLFFLGDLGIAGRYCDDCAGGRNFIAILFALCIAIVAFVLVVTFW